MKMIRHASVGLMALAFCAAASAQWYGVASAGRSKLDADCSGTTSCDTTGNGYKLLLGYKFAPNLAAEAGYFNFGKASATVSPLTLDVKADAFGGGVAFRQDFAPDWAFAARLGIASVRGKISGGVPGVGSVSGTKSSVQPYFGLGLGYKLSKTVSVDLSYDASKAKYEVAGGSDSANSSVIGLGLTFDF
jgi:OOP family OmpA-OmpF porin